MTGGYLARNRLKVAFAIAVLLQAGLAALPAGSSALDVRLDRFETGEGEMTVAFMSAGFNSSLGLSVQTGLRVVTAQFNISGLPFTTGGTDCPHSPSLDLGGDGDVEWRFNGTGYGALGHQSLISDGSSTFRVTFPPGGGTNDSMAVRLPVRAAVTDASFDLSPSGFSGTVNASVDVGADGIVDWNNRTLNAKATVSGIASLFDAYLATAPPNGTDSYGIQYVDVPVRLRTASASTLTVTNLSLRYDLTLTTGNLATKLTALIPSAIGSQNFSVPVRLGSGSAGRLRVSDIRILARPPLHAPDLTNLTPPTSPELFIDENETVNFSVRASDIYGDTVQLQWFLDLAPIAGAVGPSYALNTNYSSAGRHSVSVTAGNNNSDASVVWWVNVRDVNRAPVVPSFVPASPATVGEGSSLQFIVNASDPDGDQLSYRWTLDGREQSERAATFVFRPALGTAGYHTLALTVQDAGGRMTNLTWTVFVRKTNLPPVLQSTSPASDVVMDEGGSAAFSVSASDPNGDMLNLEWVLDGFSVSYGRYFNYSPDFSASGAHALQVLVSDGEFTVGHPWNITVNDVNHAPRAVIGSPREGEEFLSSDRLVLEGGNSTDQDRDPLTFLWYDGERLLASGHLANATVVRGLHTIRLMVEDGKGGRGSSSVNITVRQVRLVTNVTFSTRSPKEGDLIRVKVVIANEGDAAVHNLRVEFFTDGEPRANRTIPRMVPGTNVTEFFFWTAQAGKHDLTLTVDNDTVITYIHATPGMPQVVYWILAPLLLALGAVAILSVYFSVAWNRQMRKGIYDETKRRGKKKETEESKSHEEDHRLETALRKIRLRHAPYKEKPLVIKTTIPEELSPHEAIREQLTPVRKRYMSHFSSAPKGPARAPQAGEGVPVTAGVFAAKAASAVPPPPPGPDAEVEIPIALPAPEEAPAPAPEGPAAPAEAPAEAPRSALDEAQPRKPKKRIKDIEDRIHELDHKGADIAAPRRFVSLAKSFWKGGNPAKAEQYLDKAEAKLETIEKETGAQAETAPTCKKCGATVDSSWIMCPECSSKLK